LPVLATEKNSLKRSQFVSVIRSSASTPGLRRAARSGKRMSGQTNLSRSRFFFGGPPRMGTSVFRVQWQGECPARQTKIRSTARFRLRRRRPLLDQHDDQHPGMATDFYAIALAKMKYARWARRCRTEADLR